MGRPNLTAVALKNKRDVTVPRLQSQRRQCDGPGCVNLIDPTARRAKHKRFCSTACKCRRWRLDHEERLREEGRNEVRKGGAA